MTHVYGLPYLKDPTQPRDHEDGHSMPRRCPPLPYATIILAVITIVIRCIFYMELHLQHFDLQPEKARLMRRRKGVNVARCYSYLGWLMCTPLPLNDDRCPRMRRVGHLSSGLPSRGIYDTSLVPHITRSDRGFHHNPTFYTDCTIHPNQVEP